MTEETQSRQEAETKRKSDLKKIEDLRKVVEDAKGDVRAHEVRIAFLEKGREDDRKARETDRNEDRRFRHQVITLLVGIVAGGIASVAFVGFQVMVLRGTVAVSPSHHIQTQHLGTGIDETAGRNHWTTGEFARMTGRSVGYIRSWCQNQADEEDPDCLMVNGRYQIRKGAMLEFGQ